MVLATEGTPVFPDMPGIKRSNVFSITEIDKKMVDNTIGKRRVVVGVNFEVFSTAIFMVKQVKNVTMVEGAEEVGSINVVQMRKAISWLKKKNVPLLTRAQCEEITDNGLTIKTKEGKRSGPNRHHIHCDAIRAGYETLPGFKRYCLRSPFY